MAQPEYHDKQRIFFVTFYVALTSAHFILVFRFCVKLKLLPNLGQKKIITPLKITRLEQIENCRLDRLFECLYCLKLSKTSFKDRVYVIPYQRNPIVAIEVCQLLKTCTDLEKNFAKT